MTDLERIPLAPDVVNGRAAIQSALDALNQALLFIDDGRLRAVAADDTDGLMIGLENLSKFTDQLKTIVDAVRGDLDERVAGWRQVPGGDGWVGHAVSHSDTWDSEGVLREVVSRTLDRYLVEHEGEVESPFSLVPPVVAAIFACAPLTPSTGWRTTRLAEWNIDPEDWRERRKRDRIVWQPEPPPHLATKLKREATNV